MNKVISAFYTKGWVPAKNIWEHVSNMLPQKRTGHFHCALTRSSISIDISIPFHYTPSMKTAISVPDDIFAEVDRVAKDYNWSRSEVFVIAVKQYLENLKSQKVLAALNSAYSEQESLEETAFRQKSKRHFAKRVLKEA